MEAKAVAKYVRMSPIKLKPVTDLVRGKDLNEALNILKFTPGKGSEIVEKVVKSAAANAENNFDMKTFQCLNCSFKAFIHSEIPASPVLISWPPPTRHTIVAQSSR